MPIINFGTPTDWTTILAFLKSQIASAGIVDSTRVYSLEQEINEETEELPDDNTFVTIVQGLMPVNQAAVAGGGTTQPSFRVENQTVIVLWNRLGLDQPLRDDSRISDATNGLTQAWHQILKALEMQTPTSSGNYITIEPIRFLGWSYIKPTPRLGWDRMRGIMDIKFIQDVS